MPIPPNSSGKNTSKYLIVIQKQTHNRTESKKVALLTYPYSQYQMSKKNEIYIDTTDTPLGREHKEPKDLS